MSHATNHTYVLGAQAVADLQRMGLPAYPRAFEVWFSHISGEKPTLSEYVDRIMSTRNRLDLADVDGLYDTFICANRLPNQAERTSLAAMCEIEGVMTMVEAALGKTERYGESLETLCQVLEINIDRNRLRNIVESLVLATRETNQSNRLLEIRLKESQAQIRDLRITLETARAEALSDPLTGLANRRHFQEMLNKAIDQAALKQTGFALIMVDIDFFKRFNDLHSHQTGDQVLKLVTRTMRDKFPANAVVSRFGGEEFAVILPGADNKTALENAETVRQSLLTRDLIKRSTGESLGRITISLGLAVYRPGDTETAIIDRADTALLSAKRMGRNRTVTEDAMAAVQHTARVY
jgi:diguanylate cyclase